MICDRPHGLVCVLCGRPDMRWDGANNSSGSRTKRRFCPSCSRYTRGVTPEDFQLFIRAGWPVGSGARVVTGPYLTALVRAFYERDTNTVGCCLHIVTDDGNISDGDVSWCVERALENGHRDCAFVGGALLAASRTQRGFRGLRYRADTQGPDAVAARADLPQGRLTNIRGIPFVSFAERLVQVAAAPK